MHKAFEACKLQYKSLFSSVKGKTLPVLLFFFLMPLMLPFVSAAYSYGWKLEPFAYTFIINDSIANMVVSSGAVLLFSDIARPVGIASVSRHEVIKSSAGSIMYILSIAFLYVLYLIVISNVFLIPVISFSSEWGLGWKMLAYSDIEMPSQVFAISTHLIKQFTAIDAFVYSIISEWCLLVTIGLVCYCLNQATKKAWGVVCSISIIIFDITIYNSLPGWWLRYSPASLAMLSTYQEEAFFYGVTPRYGASFFIVITIVLVCLCFVIDNAFHLHRSRDG